MDQNILFAIIGVVGIIIGIIAGKIIFSKNTKKQIAEAELLAQGILKEAELRGETFKKEKELEAKERFVQMKANHDKEVFERNKKINDAENRIRQKEQSINQKEGNPDKHIKENEATIVNSEVDIKSNARQQELKDEEILQQRSVVNATSDKEARKVEDKKLNSLEKEKNNLRGDINSLNKKIVKSRADIEELEDEIEVNLQEQELVKEKITEQRALVKAMEGNLERIK